MPTALVTGAGVRVGSAIAEALAHAGYDLILHANTSTARLGALAREIEAGGRRAQVVCADLSSLAGVERLASFARGASSSLDLLVNNAGVFEQVAFEDISPEQYRRMLAINLDAPFFLTQKLLPLLHASKSPCVVNMTDIGGERAASRAAHYSLSKAGLIMLTRALAVELAPRVRVNAISPGAVAFPASATEEERGAALSRVPMRREGSVTDVAKAVVFLARDAPYVTGFTLVVDGGWSAHL